MNHRERVLAIMNYQDVDRLPVVHFGYWTETLLVWASEGHVTQEEALGWGDGNEIDVVLNQRLGWDFDWGSSLGWHAGLEPPIEERVIEELPDGSQKLLNGDGAIVLKKPGVTSIPMEFDHTLKGRREWEEIFKPRLQFVPERVSEASVFVGGRRLPFGSGGSDWLKAHDRQTAYGLYCGSLYGRIRGWLGLVNASYLQVDDEPLFDEIIDT
ncbi:MAG: hypothetical protein GX601_04295, partial [Anaerolineales bacterium]|nr:hypothetical protein [Anaerolineales bacterium]